jgi:hypothetical protein
MTGFIPTADTLFALMGITEPLPRVEYVQRPRTIDLTQYTEQELRWMAEAQQLEEQA